MSLPTHTKIILFASIPNGEPNSETFKTETIALPPLQDGQLLLQTLYLSVDPYMRGKMNGIKTYTDPYVIGEPIHGGAALKVLESKSPNFKVGDIVNTFSANWAEYNILSDKEVGKINFPIPIESSLSICGLTGLTAYFGLLDIGTIKAGETVLVTGAAGATGSMVGQIAKIYGAKVIGVVGSDEKAKFIKDLGFDVAINYKTAGNLTEAFAKAAPEKIDLFFDNVGGEQFDSAVINMQNFGRIVVCGSISTYNSETIPTGPRISRYAISKRLRIQGFIVFDFVARFIPEALPKLVQWYSEGKLKDKITVLNGLDNTVQAFLGLFKGENTGKMLVKIS